ncbi:MAG: hypothetical protein M1306_04145 [Candidatus Thermoplasmatota archaeon]|nr:hypothetical protein [Candidatus Thermoplasmatota archaeon]
MTDSRLSAAQKKLIDRFSDAKDGKRIIEKYLKETEKKTVEDLTLQEASRLITRIKDGRIQAPSTKTSPTVKQATLIRSLQDGDERIRITADYLRKMGITEISELSVSQASQLIDRLLAAKSGTKEERSMSPATMKQIRYIEKLLENEKFKKTVEDLLRKYRKKTADELTRKEAGEIIDRVIEIQK